MKEFVAIDKRVLVPIAVRNNNYEGHLRITKESQSLFVYFVPFVIDVF